MQSSVGVCRGESLGQTLEQLLGKRGRARLWDDGNRASRERHVEYEQPTAGEAALLTAGALCCRPASALLTAGAFHPTDCRCLPPC